MTTPTPFIERRKNAIAPAYLRLKDAAGFTGLSPQMLLKLTRMGQGPVRVHKGRCVLYPVKGLQEWMDQEAA